MTSVEGSVANLDAAPQDQKFVVITAHGTFAGIAHEGHVFWWQDGSQLCADIRQQKPGAMLGFEAFIWRDAEQRPGPNRESEVRPGSMIG
jgi:hypothetical protein